MRNLAASAGIERHVTAMTLRHTFAVTCLRNGMSLPELQQRLGHKTLETTARYLRCILPSDAASPLDALAAHRDPQANHILDAIHEAAAIPSQKSPVITGPFLRLLKTRLRSGFLRIAAFLLGS